MDLQACTVLWCTYEQTVREQGGQDTEKDAANVTRVEVAASVYGYTGEPFATIRQSAQPA